MCARGPPRSQYHGQVQSLGLASMPVPLIAGMFLPLACERESSRACVVPCMQSLHLLLSESLVYCCDMQTQVVALGASLL